MLTTLDLDSSVLEQLKELQRLIVMIDVRGTWAAQAQLTYRRADHRRCWRRRMPFGAGTSHLSAPHTLGDPAPLQEGEEQHQPDYDQDSAEHRSSLRRTVTTSHGPCWLVSIQTRARTAAYSGTAPGVGGCGTRDPLVGALGAW